MVAWVGQSMSREQLRMKWRFKAWATNKMVKDETRSQCFAWNQRQELHACSLSHLAKIWNGGVMTRWKGNACMAGMCHAAGLGLTDSWCLVHWCLSYMGSLKLPILKAETKFLLQNSVPWLSNVLQFVRRSKTLKKIPSTLASKDIFNILE